VSSPYEEEAPKYSSSTVFAVERLAKLLGISASELEAALTDGGGIQVVEHTPGGRAATVAVGDHTWSGRELRELLNLPSTWFEVSLDDDGRIVFTNRGYGHGVGLSQYGANGMAEKGLPYTDIIKHYYKGVSVRPIFTE
jgi:stage II sporulation protein D